MEWQPFKVNELIDLMNNGTVCFVYNEGNSQYINFKIDGIMIDKGDSINKCYVYTDLDRDDVLEEPIDSDLVGVCKSHAYYLRENYLSKNKNSESNTNPIGPRTKEEINNCINSRTIVYSFLIQPSVLKIIKGRIDRVDSISPEFLLVFSWDELECKRWSLPIERIFYTKKLVLSEIERIWE
jgi:hypothetical protein